MRHALFAGGKTPVIDRICAKRSPAVVVIPYDPIRDAVVLVEQFRVGALEDPNGPWLLELVAGVMDGEDALSCAKRELIEETGLISNIWLPITAYWVSPGASNERVHLYAAIVDASAAATLCGAADEHEDILVHTQAYWEIEAALEAGVVNNSAALIGLQWLVMHHTRLQQQYGRQS